RFSQGLPETPCVDLVLHAGSRLLRVAVFGCGVFEVPLEVPQNDPATTVFLRAHDHDLRRALIPATPHGPVPSEGATRPYADADYEELRLDASPDIRVRRAPGESPPALFHYESGFASGDTQRRTFEAFAIEAALHRSGDAVVPVTGIEDAEFQPAIERWLQRDEPNTAGAWNRTTGRGDLGNILPIDADVIVADAASADGERTHLDVAGAAFAGSNLENMVVRFAHDVGAAVNRGVVTRVTGHTDSRLEFVEIPDKVTRGDRFEILGPAPGHAMAAATTLMESDPDDVSACRTHAGRILVDVTVHTRTGPIAADRVAVALLRVPFRGLGAASPAAQLPNGWADHLRTDGGAAPGARGAWLTDGWAYFDASQQFRKPTEPLDARRPGVVTFEGSLPDGQWLLCAVVLALDDVVANAARDPFAVARTSRQVALRSVNAIAQPTVRQHAFFEWHQRAPRHGTFTPPVGRPDDSRIVLRAGAGEPLRPKARLHLCFLEQAAAAFEVTLPGGVWTASWSVVDETGAAIAWHPDYPAAGAAIANGSFVWKWDGRRDPPLGAGAPPRGRLVPQGTYRSRLVLRTAAAAGRPARAFTYTAEIIAEGEPYHIYIEGVPKNDSEILQMIADRGRAFSAGGARIPRDCWILAYRGQISDGHAVFLGQGIVEATAVTTGAGTAVATPHDRVYKCWIRDRGADEDRCQLEDVGRADGHIMLDNPGSAVPSNPRFDAEPGLAPPQPRKNNVQAHGGRQDWTTDGLTAGCTAIAPLAGLAAAADRVSERGMLRSVTSTFGNWGVPAAENPALTSPTFVNKQTKRAAANAVSDALSADDHARPILEPPVVAPLDREPLHMQAETQQGIYGGFIQGEIPLNSTVLDEPAQNANAAPKLRIRCTLRDYRRGSAYHLYHHGVVVKHEHRAAGADFEVDIWIPRKVMRGWNSPIPGEDHDPASVRRALADRRFADPLPVNRRNVLVDGRLQIRWYVRHTDGVGNQNIVHRFFPVAPVPAAQFAAQNPGRWRERWPNGATGALAAGVYESVCEYRLQVEPRGADHEWHPELAVTDALSTPSPAGATPAEISEETPHPDAVPANLQYFEATSVLHLRTVP
ncbi:MAG: hypothetical protein OEW56_05075, partial [Gemmatimonadota bacterium]|nr:hypothetical protein [Gemmatimonadota bacterium]